MHDLHTNVFSLFPNYDIGIIGSGITNPDGAKDIDVLFLIKEHFEEACKENNKKWNGWDAWNGHVRIANISKFDKKIQLIHISSIQAFEDHPHCVLLRDDKYIHEGVFFIKPEGWRYEKFPKSKL